MSDAKTTCIALYCDISGLFIQRKSDNSNALPKPVIIDDNDQITLHENAPEDADEISKYFYTTKKHDKSRESNVEKNRRLRTSIIDQEFDNWKPQFDSAVKNPKYIESKYFLIIAKEDGALYFFLLPTFQLVFVAPSASSLWTTLVDDPRYGKYNPSFGFEQAEENGETPKRAANQGRIDGIRAVQASVS